MPRLSLAAAIVVALASSSSAAILVPINGKTPPDVLNSGGAWLQINQTKPANTQLDVLADDEPMRWVGSGGAVSNYWVQKTTQKMWLWVVDNGPPSITTIDQFDLRPYYNLTFIDLQVGEAKIVDGIVTRKYIVNGVPIVFGRPVPEPSTIALAAVAAVALVRCPHCRKKQTDKGQRQSCDFCGTYPMPSYASPPTSSFHPDNCRGTARSTGNRVDLGEDAPDRGLPPRGHGPAS